ncbi:DUF2156 domain-containing protein [Methylobacter sp. S3L5C]|uniref:DUF2156 domain-containing protein n=1 Tax=Methylobacter sp. S3L5C TaxID=2839024 RepID=UPI001FABDDAB|nr:DUF2156 domain-containing protein [Methylobacter sp. S3L5C]UOA07316.1 DUF2156 domain-containing protein [Methylobacter sp. S3L5C]
MKTSLENEKQLFDRNSLVNLVRKWGDVNTEGILSATCQIFSDPCIEGFIGYRIETGNAVVFGDPVCAAVNKQALAKMFQQYCLSLKIGVVYIIVSEEFANLAVQNLGSVLIEFGEKFVLNPLSNPIDRKGSKAGLVRNRVKRARLEGALVQEYSGDNSDIEKALQEVAITWQKERQGPQVFLADFTLFNDRVGKRWFYAKKEEKIVGVILLSELQSHNGWLINSILTTKDAPHGISELLVISVLQTLAQENCQYVSMGPVPGNQLGEIIGLNDFSKTVAHWVYQLAKKVFHLGGRAAFWKKFEPIIHPSYLLFPEKNLSYSSIKSLLKALNAHV